MSGDGGPIGMDPGLRAAVADARAAERADVLAYVERHCREIDGLIARRGSGVDEVDGGLLKDRLRAFASGIKTGLHVEANADV